MSIPQIEPFAVYFMVFCRVGCCLMLMPGYSSTHLPMKVRLILAIAVSLAITPLLSGATTRIGNVDSTAAAALLIGAECLTGAFIGTIGRCLFLALQFAAGFVAQLAGYSGLPSTDDGSGELMPEIGAMISAAAVVSIFVLDFHIDVIKALIESYAAMPFGILADPGQWLDRVGSAVGQSLQLSARIAAPFVIAAILVNLAFGIVNKVAPQVPAMFISAPFLMAASLWLIYMLGPEIVQQFFDGFTAAFEKA